MDAPAVAVSRDGRTLAAAWMDMRSGRNDRDVHWTIATGGRFPREATVHDDTSGLQGHPSLAVDAEGAVWCAWEDGRGGPDVQRIYVADSRTKKNAAVSGASEGRCAFPSLAAGGGLVGVAYESRGGVVFRVLSK